MPCAKHHKTSLFIQLASICLLFFVLTQSNEAQAQTANLTVRIILASNEGSAMDSGLSSLSGDLQSRFSQYSSFQLLESPGLSLSPGQSQSVMLPNGQTVTITYQGQSGSSYRLEVQVPGGGTSVTAPPGGLFFIAGPEYQSGIIVVAISV